MSEGIEHGHVMLARNTAGEVVPVARGVTPEHAIAAAAAGGYRESYGTRPATAADSETIAMGSSVPRPQPKPIPMPNIDGKPYAIPASRAENAQFYRKAAQRADAEGRVLVVLPDDEYNELTAS